MLFEWKHGSLKIYQQCSYPAFELTVPGLQHKGSSTELHVAMQVFYFRFLSLRLRFDALVGFFFIPEHLPELVASIAMKWSALILVCSDKLYNIYSRVFGLSSSLPDWSESGHVRLLHESRSRGFLAAVQSLFGRFLASRHRTSRAL